MIHAPTTTAPHRLATKCRSWQRPSWQRPSWQRLSWQRLSWQRRSRRHLSWKRLSRQRYGPFSAATRDPVRTACKAPPPRPVGWLRRAARWFVTTRLLVLAAGLTVAVSGCGHHTPPDTETADGGGAAAVRTAPAPQTAARPEPAIPWFQDVSRDAQVAFTYRNGEESNRYTILESLGGGVAVLDYDGDGRLDFFATGGGRFEGDRGGRTSGLAGKLYRNLGGWKFADETIAAGLDAAPFYSHGALAGDFDNDGWTDLLVTGYRGLRLYHNRLDEPSGRRRFADVTQAWGLSDGRWCTSAAWGDLFGNGRLDLYVCRYLDWSEDNDPVCSRHGAPRERDVCPPQRFKPLPHALYRNTGERFEDVSATVPLAPGKGLGVAIADLNSDGRPDIYVANDDGANLLYWNEGGGKFRERANEAGVAVDHHGRYNGSMGVDVGDFDGSGRASLLVTNYQGELPALYASAGEGQFLHQSQAAGLGAVGQEFVGFGTVFADFDNDRWLDVAILNGHVLRYPAGAPFLQRPLLFHNQPRSGRRVFRQASVSEDSFFAEPALGRGLAIADFDNDGWIDLAASRCNRPLSLLRNMAGESTNSHHWLGLHLARRDRKPLAGATVRLTVAGQILTRFSKSGGSYLSSSDPRELFGLGALSKIDALSVQWPWGETQTWPGAALTVDRYWHVAEDGDLTPATVEP